MTIEEFYTTDIDENFTGTQNRIYNLKDIKITPVEANRAFDPAVPDIIVGEDTSTDVVKVTIPQLYSLVKQYDKNFYENMQAPGRAERESEIAAQQEFEQSVKKLDEHNASLDRDSSTSVPMERKSEIINENTTPLSHSGFQSRGTSHLGDGEPMGVAIATIPQAASPVNAYIDVFFHNPDTGRIDEVYYNPDGNDGNGQYVTASFGYELIADADAHSNTPDEFFDHLGGSIIEPFFVIYKRRLIMDMSIIP